MLKATEARRRRRRRRRRRFVISIQIPREETVLDRSDADRSIVRSQKLLRSSVSMEISFPLATTDGPL